MFQSFFFFFYEKEISTLFHSRLSIFPINISILTTLENRLGKLIRNRMITVRAKIRIHCLSPARYLITRIKRLLMQFVVWISRRLKAYSHNAHGTVIYVSSSWRSSFTIITSLYFSRILSFPLVLPHSATISTSRYLTWRFYCSKTMEFIFKVN